MVKPVNVPQKQTSLSDSFFAAPLDSPDFLKSVSHELRTPLNVIIGICQFLERDQKTPLSPMHRDAVGRMDRNARALLQSVNRLLASLRNGNMH
ncbi:MAG TPA: histidine kinase dimerization/phospho-acceptor domain-containing protein [Pyrinomonadaceae bacterium]|jgi:signal transduction histidine kinase|nr:histidine kinase dimerization/phospho-acceptor domain-containing protein [Pyrinomonadaceae bacterium]